MPLELLEAVPADSEAIALLFALSWTSPFTRLQFGNVDTDELARDMAPRIADHIKKPGMKFIVTKDQGSGEIASVAQWSVPLDDRPDEPEVKEAAEDETERQELEDEAYRKKLPENSNKDLIMEFTLGTRKLRKDALGEQKCYLLENLATHPSYRGQGLASKLINWAFVRADEEGVIVYLDTARDNKALQLYKKLGFEEVGSTTIESLSIYGGEGFHTHVALIRHPK
ncbi:acyl-CoA N-acyltransferase [Lophium mytilinum]|uniref:Acyl-CoA N-acyltransferase n=1 Tax=Lophium mytilinum TaxID=390894 RepID=A0A6A6QLR6_9PEZI|nr:acyl-CoA N-acyltransferase [Lophium mytilinum]